MHKGQHTDHWANDADGDNYLKDGHMISPEKPQIDVPSSLVVLSLVTNIVATELTLMRTWTPVRTGVRVAASSWKPRGLHADADVQ